MSPVQIVLSLFLGYFLAFIAAFFFREWLIGWLREVTMPVAILAFVATFGAAAIVHILVALGLGGIMAAIAVILFWSFVISRAEGATAIVILVLAGALLVVGMVAAMTRRRLRRLPASRTQG